MRIRDAHSDDLSTIAAIYDREVIDSVSTFDTEVRTPDEWAEWLRRHPADAYPVLVGEIDGQVIGWASVSKWSDRKAYARTAEVSVFIHHESRDRGVGRQLMDALIDRATQLGRLTLIARIESRGEASIRLHESLGFTRIGTMHRAGYKHGRLLDVVLMERLA